METDKLDDEYELDGKPLAKKQGDNMVKSFGKAIEHTPGWRPLVIAK